MKNLNSAYLLIIPLFFMLGCASQKNDTLKSSDGQKVKTEYEWDYNRVREMQAAEQAQKPSAEEKALEEQKSKNCTVITHAQMLKGKKSGCKKVDPRAGLGENMYCCP